MRPAASHQAEKVLQPASSARRVLGARVAWRKCSRAARSLAMSAPVSKRRSWVTSAGGNRPSPCNWKRQGYIIIATPAEECSTGFFDASATGCRDAPFCHAREKGKLPMGNSCGVAAIRLLAAVLPELSGTAGARPGRDLAALPARVRSAVLREHAGARGIDRLRAPGRCNRPSRVCSGAG